MNLSQRFISIALGFLFTATSASSQTNNDPAMVPIPLYTGRTAPAGVDPLTQFAYDTNVRFINGAQARAVLTAQVATLLDRANALEARATALEARAPVPGPKGDAGAAGSTGPQGPAGTNGTNGVNANLVAATLASLGSIKANIVQIARTTQPITTSVPAISVVGVTALAASVTTSVPGVQLGDSVQATFSGTPPTGLVITGAQPAATDKVIVLFGTTQALSLGAGAQSLSFFWTR